MRRNCAEGSGGWHEGCFSESVTSFAHPRRQCSTILPDPPGRAPRADGAVAPSVELLYAAVSCQRFWDTGSVGSILTEELHALRG